MKKLIMPAIVLAGLFSLSVKASQPVEDVNYVTKVIVNLVSKQLERKENIERTLYQIGGNQLLDYVKENVARQLMRTRRVNTDTYAIERLVHSERFGPLDKKEQAEAAKLKAALEKYFSEYKGIIDALSQEFPSHMNWQTFAIPGTARELLGFSS